MKQFIYEYEQDNPNKISFDYSNEADESIDVSIDNETATLYLNRSGMLTLAKTLIKLAEGDYKKGFHVHLHRDFNADLPSILTIVRL